MTLVILLRADSPVLFARRSFQLHHFLLGLRLPFQENALSIVKATIMRWQAFLGFPLATSTHPPTVFFLKRRVQSHAVGTLAIVFLYTIPTT